MASVVKILLFTLIGLIIFFMIFNFLNQGTASFLQELSEKQKLCEENGFEFKVDEGKLWTTKYLCIETVGDTAIIYDIIETKEGFKLAKR